MIDPKLLLQLSPGTYHDIAKNQQDDEESLTHNEIDDKILPMSQYDALDAYLEWNGIVGYTRQIWNAVAAIQAAYREKP